MMKKFKLFIFLVFLFLANLSQATCFPDSYTSENFTYNEQAGTFNSLWLVRFQLTDTDICRYDFLDNTDAFLVTRFFPQRADATPLGELGAATAFDFPYTSTLAVTTTGNNFNTNNASCWCDRTSNNAASTCSIQGLTDTENRVPAHSLLFKKCSTTNNTVFIKLRWNYSFTPPINEPSFEHCPRDTFTNLGETEVSPGYGDNYFGPGTTVSTLCQRVFVSRPTCALFIPSAVNLPTIKPSSFVGVRQESKKAIAIQLINCVNNRSKNSSVSDQASAAFPRVTLTDSNGPSTDCYLKNIASISGGGTSNTNNTVIALSLDQGFTNEICLLDFSASRNNVLTFGGASFSSPSNVVTFSQTIWAALRVGGTTPLTEVGTVRSKLMLKLDYE
jgi:hypothetical protein